MAHCSAPPSAANSGVPPPPPFPREGIVVASDWTSASSCVSIGAGSAKRGPRGTSGWLHAATEHPRSSQPAAGMLSGKNRRATRNPAVPGSFMNAVSAVVASCHLLFIAIEPERSKVMNMLTGARFAAAEPTAHAASGSTIPLPPAPPTPTDASFTTMLPVVELPPPEPMPAPAAPPPVATVVSPVPVGGLNVEPLSPAEQPSEVPDASASQAARTIKGRRYTIDLRRQSTKRPRPGLPNGPRPRPSDAPPMAGAARLHSTKSAVGAGLGLARDRGGLLDQANRDRDDGSASRGWIEPGREDFAGDAAVRFRAEADADAARAHHSPVRAHTPHHAKRALRIRVVAQGLLVAGTEARLERTHDDVGI